MKKQIILFTSHLTNSSANWPDQSVGKIFILTKCAILIKISKWLNIFLMFYFNHLPMNFLFSTYAECQNIKNNHDFLEDYFSREIKK